MGMNVRQLFEDFGGIAEVFAAFKAEGTEVTQKAMEKWRERNSVPGRHLVTFSKIARKKKKRFDIEEYLA